MFYVYGISNNNIILLDCGALSYARQSVAIHRAALGWSIWYSSIKVGKPGLALVG